MRHVHSHPREPSAPAGTESLPPQLLGTVRAVPGRVLAVVGAYGSGKSEVVVNLALQLAAAGERVQVADLDLVNPYFRCREARERMQAAGIRVVVPPGAQQFADLPIVLPEIAGLMRPPEGTLSVLDVGGDDVGARALSSFRPLLRDGGYAMWQVVNGRRPFSGTPDACRAMRDALEASSRLRVTGLLANSHLGDETTPQVVLEGLALGRATAEALGVPLCAAAVLDALADDPALTDLDVPLLRLRRRLLPPWIVDRDDTATAPRTPLPAARPTPLGVPPAVSPPGGSHG